MVVLSVSTFIYILKEFALNTMGSNIMLLMIFFGGIAQLQRNQTYDYIKDEWCRQNHISMIRIPYTVYAKKLLGANYLRNKIAMARKEY